MDFTAPLSNIVGEYSQIIALRYIAGALYVLTQFPPADCGALVPTVCSSINSRKHNCIMYLGYFGNLGPGSRPRLDLVIWPPSIRFPS